MDTLIRSLQNPQLYPHPVQSTELIETHISWVLLTGDFVYKIKKPVDFGFLDFTTIEKRHFYCQQELLLNQRLAKSLYLDVIAIYGTREQPSLVATGAIIEYAVKMVQFPQACQLDRLLQEGALTEQHIGILAEKIADFHQIIDSADKATKFGKPELVHQFVRENFESLTSCALSELEQATLQRLSTWSESEFEDRHEVFLKRKMEGFIKECHGDMHLRNIIYYQNDIVIFDCLEFSPELRWIDVSSELAFIVMDLQDRQQPAYANLLLNHYLSITGDYASLAVYRYYFVYRAMVRAKVACLRAHQAEISATEKEQSMLEFRAYLALAERTLQPAKPRLYITCGLSGSGKSQLAKNMVRKLPVIWLRSDVERKRAHGISQLGYSHSGVDSGIYDHENSEQLYNRLHKLAELILNEDYSVIVDASFLLKRHRDLFFKLAHRLSLEIVIIECVAKTDSLKERIIRRQENAQDASEANLSVLYAQQKKQEKLSELELGHAVRIDTEVERSADQILQLLNDG